MVIDCDPGQDDAIALLLASADPTLDVLAVTTVAGNAPVDRTDRTARSVMAHLARHGYPTAPVHRGCHRPLVGPLTTYFDDHHEDDLPGWPHLPPPLAPAAGHAVTALADALAGRPAGTVTVLALGPLTNLAAALVADDEIADRIGHVVALSGDLRGARGPAEFNARTDPHAAHVVLASGIPVTLVPADACERVALSTRDLDHLAGLDGPLVEPTLGLLRHYGNAHDRGRYRDHGRPLYDPAVVALASRPDLAATTLAQVRVETCTPDRLGSTEIRPTDDRTTVRVVTELDGDGYLAHLARTLAG